MKILQNLRFKSFWFVCFFLFCAMNYAFGQQAIVDSLQQLYENADKDEDRIIYMSKIAFYNVGSNPDSSLQIAKKTLKEAQLIDFQDGIGSCYNTIGWAYFHKGQNDKAVEYIQSAINIYQKIPNAESTFSSYFNLSSVFIRQENYAEALKYLLATLPLIEQFPEHVQVTGVYKNLGIVYRQLKEYDKASEYFKKAININLKNNHHYLAADIKTSLGILYSQTGKYKEAIIQYEESYAIYKQEKSVYGMSIIRENQGELFFDQKKYKLALASFEEALEGYKILGNEPDIAYISLNIAKVYAAMKEYDKAINVLEKGLIHAQQTGARNYEMDIYAHLSDTYQEQNDFEPALKYYKDFQRLKDSLKSDGQVNQLNRIRTEFETKQKDQQISLLNAEQLIQNEKNTKKQIIAIGLILIAISLAIISYNRSKLSNKEKIVIGQEKKLAQQKQQETEQMLLRSQMNPHFIFNCLNTIDSFVLQNRKLDASELIQRFSRLSRQILEYSALDEITIREEIEMCRVYLQIEQTRYPGKFDIEIMIDNHISAFMMPPMIIQPFVENAVIHGVRNRFGDGGRISVLARIDKNRVKFTIADNGVGRKLAQLIKQEQLKSEDSKAMEITTSRLSALNNTSQVSNFINYIDIEGEENGTEVEIWIPIIHPINQTQTHA